MLLIKNTIIKKLLNLSKQVSKYCVGMEGNISGKYGNYFYIKSSGGKLNKLKLDDLIKFNFDGTQLNNFKKKGSMEIGFHTFLLGHENINFISHTHPIKTLSILCGDKISEFANNRMFPDQVIFNGEKSCVIPYVKPGEDLSEIVKIKVNQFIKDNGFFPKLILLKNHGIIACGSSIDECVMITDICEKSSEIFLNTSNINFLTIKEITDLLKDTKEKYRKSLL
jgi:ribulose-5-phosphate 4-epimerase/fuculose-1-phosphate aldolase